MARRVLQHTGEVLPTVPFDHDSLDQALRAAAAQLGLKAGQAFQPIRVAVCGRKNAPPLFETMVVLGRDVCLARIRQAEANLQSARISTDICLTFCNRSITLRACFPSDRFPNSPHGLMD